MPEQSQNKDIIEELLSKRDQIANMDADKMDKDDYKFFFLDLFDAVIYAIKTIDDIPDAVVLIMGEGQEGEEKEEAKSKTDTRPSFYS